MSDTEAQVAESSESLIESTDSGDEISGRPEYIPEKYWDQERGTAKVEDMGKGYIELSSKLGQRDEKIREEISAELKSKGSEGVPESPDKYDFQVEEGILPEGTEFKLDKENPVFQEFNEFAHKNGLNQNQYNAMLSLYAKNELAMRPDFAAEKQKLGDNAQARIERVDLWAKANLTESSYDSIVRNASSGEFILAMEELINKASPADIEGQNDVQNIGPLTRDELEAMMKDPRYRDPRHRDPSFVRRVEDGFKTLKS